MLLMAENYGTNLFWNLLRQCPNLVVGLRRAGFFGSWLGAENSEGTDRERNHL
jgi:hypothetical protein